MKHKVGDKVKIKSLEWYNNNKDKYGFVHFSNVAFSGRMVEFCGKEAVVTLIVSSFYRLDIDNQSWLWVDNMFEDESNTLTYIDEVTYLDAKKIAKFMSYKKKDSILTEAQNILNGNRQADCGDAVENFKNIAKCASEWSGKELTALDCVNVMIAVKTKREQFKHKQDNLVDLTAYLEIRRMILQIFQNKFS